MKAITNREFTESRTQDLAYARRLETFSILYSVSAATVLFLVMGGSQAVRTSFFEDAISTLPAIAFLICAKVALRPATPEFPYGFHGIVSIGYLTASLGLFAMGVFLVVEAAVAFFGEPPSLGEKEILGQQVWEGWIILVALFYSAVPAFFLGRMKLKLAPRLHDKILFADAQMMKADWMAESGTAAGVIGIGLGFAWADPLAAALVSLSIINDGQHNIRVAIEDLIERRPMKADRSDPNPAPEALRRVIERLDWVAEVQVRLREVGHVLFGEVFVRPKEGDHDFPRLVREARECASTLSWRIHDVTVTVMDDLEKPEPIQDEGDAGKAG